MEHRSQLTFVFGYSNMHNSCFFNQHSLILPIVVATGWAGMQSFPFTLFSMLFMGLILIFFLVSVCDIHFFPVQLPA